MNPIEIHADLAGTVFQVALQPGAAVDDCTVILVLESMKMEIPVTSPRNGTLAEVKVKVGDVVQEGQLIAIVNS
jgi:acetyl-CoA carboxylase biotin carboxyl carrier protein